MRLHRAFALGLVLPACGSAETTTRGASNVPAVPVDVAPPPAPVEVKVRGALTLDVAELGADSFGVSHDQDLQIARTATRELAGCFRHEPPAPADSWMVLRVSVSGRVDQARAASDVSPSVQPCLTAAVTKLQLEPTQQPFALSLVLHTEPAPSDCKGEACSVIPSEEPTADGEGEGALGDGSYGILGVLSNEPEGSMFGTEVGDAFGVGGLGLVGTGQGGGGTGDGTIGLGSIGTIGHGAGTGLGRGYGAGSLGGKHSGKVPAISAGTTNVSAGLPPEVVRRIVRQSFGRLRLCYEKELTQDPKLEGTVSTSFTIDRNGSVTKVTDAKSDLKNPKVIACVEKTFQGLSFPQPEGGSAVSVTYPIHFDPGHEPPPPPVYTVGGEHFPLLTPATVEKKLAQTGWRTMSVRADGDKAPFAVFAVKKGTSMSRTEHPDGFVTSAVWAPATIPFLGPSRESEGFRLHFDGADSPDLERDLIDPEPAAKTAP